MIPGRFTTDTAKSVRDHVRVVLRVVLRAELVGVGGRVGGWAGAALFRHHEGTAVRQRLARFRPARRPVGS
jgi:uncharacterized membrane protein YsdA (DUF1294 family)